jgi:hypothetical protein
MDLGPLRALTCVLVQDAFGVPATVTLPLSNPVTTTGVWVRALEEAQPFGTDLVRRDPRRVLAIPRTAVLDAVPRGTVILAAEMEGGPTRMWRVDGLERTEADLFRVIVVQQ